MTDYAELRAALDEAPTPGPWRVQATGHSFIIESHTHTESFSVDSEGRRCRWSEHTEATAKLISACSPETIRALLAERDALIHDNSEYVSAANELATENQRLREALEWSAGILQAACANGHIHELSRANREDSIKTVGEILDMADAALAQEQGGSDDA